MLHIKFVGDYADEENPSQTVVVWEGCKPEEFVEKLKTALIAWFATKEGAEAFLAAKQQFCLNDLYQYIPTQEKSPEFNRCLWRENIRYLRIVDGALDNFLPDLVPDEVLVDEED